MLYTHLSDTTEDSEIPSVDTALKAFMYHGRLGAHLQHNVSFLFFLHCIFLSCFLLD